MILPVRELIETGIEKIGINDGDELPWLFHLVSAMQLLQRLWSSEVSQAA
jgi:hypothetical protein